MKYRESEDQKFSLLTANLSQGAKAVTHNRRKVPFGEEVKVI